MKEIKIEKGLISLTEQTEIVYYYFPRFILFQF